MRDMSKWTPDTAHLFEVLGIEDDKKVTRWTSGRDLYHALEKLKAEHPKLMPSEVRCMDACA